MSLTEGQPRQERVKEIFRVSEAVLTDDHFVYTSGKHGRAYINKDAVYPHTRLTRELCKMMAEDFKDDFIEVVAGPEKGGIILATHTAAALSDFTDRDVFGIYAEKFKIEDQEYFEFRRGYDGLIKARRILIVEDLLTTGGSVDKMVSLCRSLGGDVVGVAALANRGKVTSDNIGGALLKTLLDVDMESWPEEDCQLCKTGVPVNILLGKGSEFLKRKLAQG